MLVDIAVIFLSLLSTAGAGIFGLKFKKDLKQIKDSLDIIDLHAKEHIDITKKTFQNVDDIKAQKDITLDAISEILDRQIENHKQYLDFVNDTTQILDDISSLEEHIKDLTALNELKNIPALQNLQNHLVAVSKLSRKMLSEIKQIEFNDEEE